MPRVGAPTASHKPVPALPEEYAMSRRFFANLFSWTLALLAGAVTLFVSIRYLTAPDRLFDWIIQICAGLTVGIIVFFLSWGHFQKPPTPNHPTPPRT